MAVENAQLPVIGNDHVAGPRRDDLWWISPLMTFLVFTAFIVYTTWRTFENGYYNTAVFGPHYLSPFYSPEIGAGLRIHGINITPAIWILPFPLLFRATCYYYRKAYYRAYFWDPPACAVTEVAKRKHYTGEREFPYVAQNLHRYAFYFAAIIMVILWVDAYDAFWFTEPDGSTHFFIGLGSVIFLVNVVLLSMYTFSCHSWRHLVGGCVNCFSCSTTATARHGIWKWVSRLNENHSLWAWCSLISVGLTDYYVRCVYLSPSIDFHIFH